MLDKNIFMDYESAKKNGQNIVSVLTPLKFIKKWNKTHIEPLKNNLE